MNKFNTLFSKILNEMTNVSSFKGKENSFQSPYDDQWREEIDDSKMEIDFSKFKKSSYNNGVIEFSGKLSDVLSHSELFDAVPQLEKVVCNLVLGERNLISTTKIINNIPHMNVKNINKDKFYGHLIHEIQHVVQYYHGFAYGDSTSGELTTDEIKVSSEIDKKLIEIQNNIKKNYSLYDKNKLKSIFFQKINEIASQVYFGVVDDIVEYIINFKLTYKILQYYRTAGELESKNTSDRLKLGREDRIKQPQDFSRNIKNINYKKNKSLCDINIINFVHKNIKLHGREIPFVSNNHVLTNRVFNDINKNKHLSKMFFIQESENTNYEKDVLLSFSTENYFENKLTVYFCKNDSDFKKLPIDAKMFVNNFEKTFLNCFKDFESIYSCYDIKSDVNNDFCLLPFEFDILFYNNKTNDIINFLNKNNAPLNYIKNFENAVAVNGKITQIDLLNLRKFLS